MTKNATARMLAAQAVCLGSATLAAAYYSAWASSWPIFCVLAALAFALDLVKPQLFVAASHAVREKRYAAACTSWVVGALIAIVSMIAVDGMMLKLRGDSADDKTNTMSTYDRADGSFQKAKAELEALGAIEPKATLEAKLQGSVPVDVWKRTRQCTEVSQPDSRKACEPAFALRELIGKAERRQVLERELKVAMEKLDAIRRPSSADPQIDAMAKVSGLDHSVIMLILTWLAGLAFELVSCLAPWLLTRDADDEFEPESTLTPEQQALQWVLGEMSKSAGKLEILNGALAVKFSVDPGTVTRWRQKWVEAGIIEETRKGRTIQMRMLR